MRTPKEEGIKKLPIDEIKTLDMHKVYSRIKTLETCIKREQYKIMNNEARLEVCGDAAKQAGLATRIKRSEARINQVNEILPNYIEAYAQMKHEKAMSPKTASVKEGLKDKWNRHAAAINAAMKRAMIIDSFAPSQDVDDNHFVIAVSPYTMMHENVLYENLKDQTQKEIDALECEKFSSNHFVRSRAYAHESDLLKTLKMRLEEKAVVSHNYARNLERDLDEKIRERKLNTETDIQRFRTSIRVAANDPQDWKTLDIIYRFQRHIMAYPGHKFGNVEQVRYADGIVYMYVRINHQLQDKSLDKQLYSACISCYLDSSKAIVYHKRLPAGTILWDKDDGQIRRFSMQYIDLLDCPTYLDVYTKVKSEFRKNNINKTYAWWIPVDVDNLDICKPSTSCKSNKRQWTEES